MYFSARAQYRKAQLTAKRNTVLTQRKEREALLAGAQSVVKDLNTPYGRRKPQDTLSQDDILLNASNDITASLARTHSLLSAELQRSQFARETLGQAHAAHPILFTKSCLTFGDCRELYEGARWFTPGIFQP